MVKALHPLGLIASRIELPPEVRVPVERNSDGAAGREKPSLETDPAAAAFRALESPLNHPPLAKSVVQGDRLAIAIDETVPCAAGIVRGVVLAAELAGIEPDAIAIVTSDEVLGRALRGDLQDAVRVAIHDPDDPANLCLLGLNGKHQPLLLNRNLFDADVVLPIGCARLPGVAGSGVYDSLFPRMSDARTIAQLRTPSQRSSLAARRQADEAGWLLGVSLVMQVMPGSDGTVDAVIAGAPHAVAERCRHLCEQRWSFRVPRRASLVIVNVTGGPQEQTWDNVGRALAAAEPLVADGGAVAVCSDLETRPGQALGQLVGNCDYLGVEKNVHNDHSADSWPAWQLARALERGPVYFLSQLDVDDVEAMGLAPIADVKELTRLASRQESCIVLDDSQYAVATVANES